MKKIILIGGGGHCKSIIDVIEHEGKFRIAGIIDKPELIGNDLLGYKVIGHDLELNKFAKKYEYALISIGQIHSPEPRKKLFNLAIKAGFNLPKIISPRAFVSSHASIGNGTVIMHDAIVNAGASVGENCIINSKALIEHDSSISNHCHISTNAVINGDVIIEDDCFIGSGTVVINSAVIKRKSLIKAGVVVK